MSIFRLTFVLLALFAMAPAGVEGRHARRHLMETRVPASTKVPKGTEVRSTKPPKEPREAAPVHTHAPKVEPSKVPKGRRHLRKNDAVRRNVQEEHSLVGKRANIIQGGMRLK